MNKELQSITKEKANQILEKTSNERQIIFSIMENIKNSNDKVRK